MITFDRLPKTGQLIIAINFKGYDDYYANETRKVLKDLPNRRDIKKIDLELYPLDYWLKRTVISKIEDEKAEDFKKRRPTKATGGLYKIGFMNMTPDKYKSLYRILLDMKKTYWDEIELLVADKMEEIQ
jgi:hypothetical protein